MTNLIKELQKWAFSENLNIRRHAKGLIEEFEKIERLNCPHNNQNAEIVDGYRIYHCLDCGKVVKIENK